MLLLFRASEDRRLEAALIRATFLCGVVRLEGAPFGAVFLFGVVFLADFFRVVCFFLFGMREVYHSTVI